MLLLADEYKLDVFYERCLEEWQTNLTFNAFQNVLKHGQGRRLPAKILCDLINGGFSCKYCRYQQQYYR
jgi:hypothetical protein